MDNVDSPDPNRSSQAPPREIRPTVECQVGELDSLLGQIEDFAVPLAVPATK